MSKNLLKLLNKLEEATTSETSEESKDAELQVDLSPKLEHDLIQLSHILSPFNMTFNRLQLKQFRFKEYVFRFCRDSANGVSSYHITSPAAKILELKFGNPQNKKTEIKTESLSITWSEGQVEKDAWIPSCTRTSMSETEIATLRQALCEYQTELSQIASTEVNEKLQ